MFILELLLVTIFFYRIFDRAIMRSVYAIENWRNCEREKNKTNNATVY